LWLSLGGAVFLLTAHKKWRAILWAIFALAVTAAIFSLSARRADFQYPTYSRFLWLAGIIGLFFAYRANFGARFGKSIAITALALVVVYWSGLAVAHQRALYVARITAQDLAMQNGENLIRLAAMPTLADPLSWLCVFETDGAVYRFKLDLNRADEALNSSQRFAKPGGVEAGYVASAANDSRARIFLDFARFPVARVRGDCLSETLVQFADLRYTEPGATTRGTFALDVQVACEPTH
jgi:hypothetical protein